MSEMLSVQGFPTSVEFTHGMACSSYAKRFLDKTIGWRRVPAWPSRHALCSQSGNSMHTTISGVIVLYVLTQIIMDVDLLALQQFQRLRKTWLAIGAPPNVLNHLGGGDDSDDGKATRGEQKCVKNAQSHGSPPSSIKRRRVE